MGGRLLCFLELLERKDVLNREDYKTVRPRSSYIENMVEGGGQKREEGRKRRKDGGGLGTQWLCLCSAMPATRIGDCLSHAGCLFVCLFLVSFYLFIFFVGLTM